MTTSTTAVVDLWQLAKDKLAEQEAAATVAHDQLGRKLDGRSSNEEVVLVCGSKSAGKSSMVDRFLEKREETKPTIALEYTFARRTRGEAKDVAHVWELGGGIQNLDLIQIPLTAENVEIASVVIVLDPTRPHELWSTLDELLTSIRKRTQRVAQQLTQRLLATAAARMEGHKDASMLSPFPLPLALVLGRWDEFQKMGSLERRVILSTLRFVAHYHVASFLCWSSSDESSVQRGRQLLGALAFGAQPNRQAQMDVSQPMYIPAGGDSLEEIGPPPVDQLRSLGASASQPLQLWKSAFCEHFPQTERKIETTASVEDDREGGLFAEPAIDAIVAQRMRDLELYIRQKKDRAAAEQRAKNQIENSH